MFSRQERTYLAMCIFYIIAMNALILWAYRTGHAPTLVEVIKWV